MEYTLETKLDFGKYKGCTVQEIIDDAEDASYLEWCMDNLEWFELDNEALEKLSISPYYDYS